MPGPSEHAYVFPDDEFLLDIRDLNGASSIWPGAYALLLDGEWTVFDGTGLAICKRRRCRDAWRDAAVAAAQIAAIRAKKAADTIDFPASAITLGPVS